MCVSYDLRFRGLSGLSRTWHRVGVHPPPLSYILPLQFRRIIMHRHTLKVVTGIAASFIVALNALIPSAFAQANGKIRSLRGFSGANAAAEINWEEKMRSIPKPELLRDYMKHLSAEPHHLGSA